MYNYILKILYLVIRSNAFTELLKWERLVTKIMQVLLLEKL